MDKHKFYGHWFNSLNGIFLITVYIDIQLNYCQFSEYNYSTIITSISKLKSKKKN